MLVNALGEQVPCLRDLIMDTVVSNREIVLEMGKALTVG